MQSIFMYKYKLKLKRIMNLLSGYPTDSDIVSFLFIYIYTGGNITAFQL